MKLIVGLGNPGRTYKKTRHNVGYQIIDLYLANHKLKEKYEPKFEGFISEHKKTIFLKPTTYMNLSGNSIYKVMNYYKIDISDILVIVDDLNLGLAELRLRESGSSGGHNGLKSVENILKTNNYKRLRVGIGKEDNATKHVLSKFSKKERKELEGYYLKVLNVLEGFINDEPFSHLTKYIIDEKIK